MPADRDRDERGRARNARPRDALGRPLPRGETPQHIEEDLPEDPTELLRIGAEHFDAKRFFQAHEAWETAWHPAPPEERDFWQGITQVAVGFTHLQRGNPRGAVTLLQRGARRLESYPDGYKGFPVVRVRDAARAAAGSIERDGAEATVEHPVIG